MRSIFAGLGLEGDFGIRSRMLSVNEFAHERWGEAPHAFVVLKQGARADERELFDLKLAAEITRTGKNSEDKKSKTKIADQQAATNADQLIDKQGQRCIHGREEPKEHFKL